jgi:S-adenosylmethionine hydrolase
MPPPVVAWLSDFGTRDHYAGTMKGVALGIIPEALFVDITHEIEPQDILGGALELSAAFKFFPQGTIFVAVVDPGVGSSRRAIAARAGGYFFVGPDNGVLALALETLEPRVIVELTDQRFALPTISRTFEGRDRFAPAAAWLARGVTLEDLGPTVSTMTELPFPTLQTSTEQLRGEVIRIDRYGNAITNISRRALDAWRGEDGVVFATGPTILDGIVATYAQAKPGSPCALFGSVDYLEVAVTNGHAASALGLSRGSAVTATRAR